MAGVEGTTFCAGQNYKFDWADSPRLTVTAKSRRKPGRLARRPGVYEGRRAGDPPRLGKDRITPHATTIRALPFNPTPPAPEIIKESEVEVSKSLRRPSNGEVQLGPKGTYMMMGIWDVYKSYESHRPHKSYLKTSGNTNQHKCAGFCLISHSVSSEI